MSAELLPMVLDIEVARHKREVAEGFAALRKSWEPPKREPTMADTLRQMLMLGQGGSIAEQRRLAELQYNACNPMSQQRYGFNEVPMSGLLGGLFCAGGPYSGNRLSP